MDTQILKNTKKIWPLLNNAISKNKRIDIKLTGVKEVFKSQILKLNNMDDTSDESEFDSMIIQSLEPNKGNELIHSNPEIEVSCSINEKSFRFISKFMGINNLQQPFGLLISIPDSIELKNNRVEERYTYEMPEFVAAEFTLGKGTEEEKKYELNVLDCSIRGLGLLIDDENRDLLKRVKIGDRLNEITFFATWMMATVTGTVKHMTKINYGKYEGKYIMGIESQELIESCKPPK